jgi:acyl dehydratase
VFSVAASETLNAERSTVNGPTMSPTLTFDTVDVGDELPRLQLILAGDAVRRYAEAANMPGGRFMSDADARAEGLPGQIVPGNLSLALFSRLLTEWNSGVRLTRLSATFRALVRPTSR